MLASVSISCWSAKKIAKKESEELTNAKSASRRAAQVHKNLLADDVRLTKVNKYAAEIRNWLAVSTLPWSDSGLRLVTTKQFMDFKAALDAHKTEFEALVKDFVVMYPTLISAQAFKLGSMFDRNEYPSEAEVARKFSLSYSFMPVPEAGDFRVDIAEDIRKDLEEQYAKDDAARIEEVNRDLWGRLKTVLDKISDRLGVEGGKNKIFRDTLVENALEVCDMLSTLNVTGDAQLETARKEVQQALLGVTADDLRKSEGTRQDVKAQVEGIIDKFNW